MASTQPAPTALVQASQKKKDPAPGGFQDVFTKSLKVGAATGTLGLFWAATSSIVRGQKNPISYTIARGCEWFASGTLFYGTRHLYLSTFVPVDKTTPRQKLVASTLSAALSHAAVVGLLRHPAFLPGAALQGSLLGGGGQLAVNIWTSAWEQAAGNTIGSWLEKYSPLQKLTERDFEHILEEKILAIDAQIALLDDDIAALKAQKEGQEGLAAKANRQTPPSKDQS